MKLLLCKACEYSSTLANGRQCLIGIFENIRAEALPLEHPPFYLVLEVEFEPSEGDVPLDLHALLINPDGKPLLDLEAVGTTPKDPGGGPARLFVSFHLPGLTFSLPGDHRIDIRVNGEAIGDERIPVALTS